jgi:hypothetical protein
VLNIVTLGYVLEIVPNNVFMGQRRDASDGVTNTALLQGGFLAVYYLKIVGQIIDQRL